MELKTSAIAGLLGLSTRRINQLAEEGVAVRISPGTFDATATPSMTIALPAHVGEQ